MADIYEYTGNMHMHTIYSDGAGTHQDIADAALKAGLNFVIVTDHNVRVDNIEGYYGDDKRGYVLLLSGQEIHDRHREPMVNHCLVYNVPRELSTLAENPQELLNEIKSSGGLSFLAHPYDKPVPWMRSGRGIPWVEWDVENFTGLEIWNYMAVFKDALETPWKSFRRVFRPEEVVTGPRPKTLAKWDELLTAGKRVVGIGNSDAHAAVYRMGLLRHTVFPYDYLFHCVNTHVLLPQALTGNADYDAQLIYHALGVGRAFISYQIPGKARGFRFSAQGAQGGSVQIGGSIRAGQGVTLQTLAPGASHIKLIYEGRTILEDYNTEALVDLARQPGAYRVEVWREYKGAERCWILSNPIYVEPNLTEPASQGG